MLIDAMIIALPSAALFGALVLMSDRPRGAALAQGALALAAVPIFLSILFEEGIGGLGAPMLAGIGAGLVSAAIAGMLYHLYLGRFMRVWAARRVFAAVYLGVSALFGLVILSLI